MENDNLTTQNIDDRPEDASCAERSSSGEAALKDRAEAITSKADDADAPFDPSMQDDSAGEACDLPADDSSASDVPVGSAEEDEDGEDGIPYASTRIIWLICGICFIAIGALLIYKAMNGQSVFSSGSEPTPTPYSVGASYYPDSMGAFTVEAENGSLGLMDLAGKPAIVHFFSGSDLATTNQLTLISDAYGQYGEDIAFIPVFVGDRSTADAIYDFADIKMPLYCDPQGEALAACGREAAPATFFVDEDGFITASSDGSLTEDALSFGIGLLLSRTNSDSAE